MAVSGTRSHLRVLCSEQPDRVGVGQSRHRLYTVALSPKTRDNFGLDNQPLVYHDEVVASYLQSILHHLAPEQYVVVVHWQLALGQGKRKGFGVSNLLSIRANTKVAAPHQLLALWLNSC